MPAIIDCSWYNYLSSVCMESDETSKTDSASAHCCIRMNDGREYFVEKPEFITVGDYTAVDSY